MPLNQNRRPDPPGIARDVGEVSQARPGFFPAVFLFAAGSLLLAWPWLSGKVTIPWDAKAEFYPSLVFLARSLHAGEWPFWVPNVFAGQPQIADPQSLLFSPQFLLLAALDPLPGFRAQDAAVFATLFGGGLAIIAFFRDRGWHPAGALVAAFAFAYGGSNAWRIQHIGQVMSLCWFALALWLLARALGRRSAIWGACAGLAAGLLIAGRDQVALLCTLVLCAFVVAHLLRGGEVGANIAASLKPLAAGAVAGVLTIALPIALTMAFAAQSNRPEIGYSDAVAASLHPAALFTLVSADLFGTAGPMAKYWGPPNADFWADQLALARNMADIYIGALPVIAMLIAGVARAKLFERDVRFFTLAALACLLYALGKFTPFFQIAYLLPGADLFRRPADATFPFGALLAIVAGYLVHRHIGRPRETNRDGAALGGALVVTALLACAWIAEFKGQFAQASPALLVATASFLAAALVWTALPRFKNAPQFAVAFVAAFMTLDLAISNAPNESTGLPPSEYDVLRPDTSNTTIAFLAGRLEKSAAADRRDRVEMPAIGFAWPDSAMIHGFDHSLGYNPLILDWYARATGAIDHVAIAEQRKFSPLFANYRSPMLDLLGVRFVASGVPLEQIDKSFREGDLKQIGRTADAFIYENPHALPRVVLATQAQSADFAQMIKTGVWPVVDFSKTVLLEAGDSPKSAPPLAEGDLQARARLLAYRNTEVVAEANSPAPGWLVLHDVWHPWWRVEVDGRPAKMLRANVIFRAVAVPAGRHEVRFRFEPLRGLLASLRGE